MNPIIKKLEKLIPELQETEETFHVLYEDGEETFGIYSNLDYFTAAMLAAHLIIGHNIDAEDLILLLTEEQEEANKKRSELLRKEMKIIKKLNQWKTLLNKF
jgi:hypothetical protein